MSTGTNEIFEDGRKSGNPFSRVSGHSKSGKDDSRSMLLPSTDLSSKNTPNLRNAKSMMLSYDAPDTSQADLITRDDGFNLGLGRETLRHDRNINLSADAIPGAIEGTGSAGRPAGIKKNNMKGKKAGKKDEAKDCTACETPCTIF